MLAAPAGGIPNAAVGALVAVMAIGGPASAVGFALARDYNRADLVGTASGVVNVGGFSAVIAISLLMGLVLDVAGGAITGIHAFLDVGRLFPEFGLPAHLPAAKSS